MAKKRRYLPERSLKFLKEEFGKDFTDFDLMRWEDQIYWKMLLLEMFDQEAYAATDKPREEQWTQMSTDTWATARYMTDIILDQDFQRDYYRETEEEHKNG